MKYSIIILALLFASIGEAKKKHIKELGPTIVKEIEPIAVALANNQPLPANAGDWEFKRFRFRFRLPIGFGVSGLSKFEIIPEIELDWKRS